MRAGDWKFAVDDVSGRIFALFDGPSYVLLLRIDVVEETERILCHLRVERNCPLIARRRMSVWCNLKNWELQFGFFFCDQRDGEIGFRDSLDVRGVEVTAASLDNLLKRAVSTMSQNYLEIVRIIACADE
jgi:hypothetical protein